MSLEERNKIKEDRCPFCGSEKKGINKRKKVKVKIKGHEKWETLKEIGKRIKAYRVGKGLSQMKLANVIGINRSTIGHIELGKIEMTVSYIYKIADGLEETVHNLLPV